MPASHAETVEFLLSTNAEEMQFETMRCRPMLTPALFEHLGEQIGAPATWPAAAPWYQYTKCEGSPGSPGSPGSSSLPGYKWPARVPAAGSSHALCIGASVWCTVQARIHRIGRPRPPACAAAGSERFAARPDEARVAELLGLRDYLVQAVQDIDGRMQELTQPRERVMKLLQAQDKRAALLQMAGGHQLSQLRWLPTHPPAQQSGNLPSGLCVQATTRLTMACSTSCSRT